MGKLIVIEGLDGAGKNTLARAVTEELTARGAHVIGRAFPRYGEDIHADLARDGLHGRLGDLTESVNGMALLFALDRRAAADQLRADLDRADVVLVDRYVASNAAYGAARLHQDADGEIVEWVRALEIDRFGIPVPDEQILLRVPVAVAADRARSRESTDATRARDSYESDDSLQTRCGRVYEQLADRGWLSPWRVVDGVGQVDAASLVAAF
ncbi:dTMP kinase [Haloechinothrix salitolerans]|uniref:Thymidylate kinase n=1 Tax=Haloechinothrix salitolerans TaxID=926830 RepID=A0ABW2BYU7_9PSEU